jgi:hypothetical protein
MENEERIRFEEKCRQPHLKMRRCFMTGKTCVYEELIEHRLLTIQDGKEQIEGFMIMAFRPNLNAFYNWSLVRFFKNRYGANTEILKRADQIRRTGYVICEKICRRMQEASFVVADLSINNENVLYELGIAYGLRHKLLIVHDVSSPTAEMLRKKFLPEEILPKIYAYPSIKPISAQESFSQRFFLPPEPKFPDISHTREPRIVVLSLAEKTGDSTSNNESMNDIKLSFMDVIKGAVGVSIDNIVHELKESKMEEQLPSQYVDIIEKMKTASEIGSSQDTRFEAIKSSIDSAFCVLIRTSNTHPFSYFWLGYCHAIGKNVIPIYEVEKPDDTVFDLAFDIRSLWHLVLVKKDPTRILPELEEILKQMILTDFAEWSRKSFWSRIFGRSGRVAIFTGALHNSDFKREMVGDWDLRTASELMSYFSTHQLLSTIESPIYQPEKVKVNPEKYLEQISRLLKDRNAIVIASPDVNPLTELLLGKLYGVPDKKLFSQQFDPDGFPNAVASIKKRKIKESITTNDNGTPKKRVKQKEPSKVNRFFFLEEESKEDIEHRGFRGNWLPGKELLKEYLGQMECKDKDFELYAHLVIAVNPFSSNDYYVIILNGISGPSTFALTQLLTGGIGQEFVDYSGRRPGEELDHDVKSFNPHATAELILRQLNEKLDKNVIGSTSFCGVQMIVKVIVGPPAGADQYLTFDSRRVKKWELVPDSLQLISAKTC